MFRHLSLGTLVSSVVGAILFGALSAFALGTALWIERRTESEQRTAVTLIASEATRVIQSGFHQHGRLLPAESIQQLIHARWVRDPDIIRVSVQLPDQTIIADTDTRLIGTRAKQSANQVAASVVFRETADSPASRIFMFPVQSEDRQDLCLLVILVSTRAVMTDFYLIIESTLQMAIPVLSLLLFVVAGLGFWLSRRVLQRVLPSATLVLVANPQGEPHEGLTEDMSDVIAQLEVAAHRLQDLAAR
jgi:hypothetical protein